jgi:glutamate-1-semialdehyde 2,1-aminomutase
MTLDSTPVRDHGTLPPATPARQRHEAETARYRARTPASLREWERARVHVPFGVGTNFRIMDPYPLYLRAARGARVEDLDGNSYIDWALGQTTMVTGHAHPAVLAAARGQMEKGTLSCFPSPLLSRLAEVVCERFRLETVRFVNTGSEAVFYPVRVARAATGRDKVLKFDTCYHGSSPEFMQGKATANLRPSSPAWLAEAQWTNGLPRAFTDLTVVADYNDLDSVRACFKDNPGQIAAVVVEPVGLNLGVLIPRDGFLKGLREICDREGALLIYDEVKVGCKLGPLGAGEYFGVAPDLVAMAKTIGGGFPIGLFGGRADLMRQIETGGVAHVGTYAANPLSLAAALATLTEVLTPATYERIFATARALADGYRDIVRRTGIDAHVVDIGASGCLFLNRGQPFTRHDFVRGRHEVWPVFWFGMLNRGVIVQGHGPEDGWTVSAQHTEEDVEASLRAFREVAPLLA